MKNKSIRHYLIIAIILFSFIIISVLIQQHSPNDVNTPDITANDFGEFKTIPGYEYLSYSVNTNIVWYMFSTSKDIGTRNYSYSYFSPYISENGRYCKYIDGKIVELT